MFTGSRPGCHWQCLIGPADEGTWTRYIDHMIALQKQVQPGDVVLDLWFDAGRPSAADRARFTSEFSASPVVQRVRAHAVATNSPISRGILTAVNWVIKRPFDERLFATPDAALTWLATMAPDLNTDAVQADLDSAIPGFRSLRW